MQKIHMTWNIYFIIPTLCLDKKTKPVVDLAAWIMHLSTLGNLFLRELLQGNLNHRHIIKYVDIQAGLKFKLQLCLKNKGT